MEPIALLHDVVDDEEDAVLGKRARSVSDAGRRPRRTFQTRVVLSDSEEGDGDASDDDDDEEDDGAEDTEGCSIAIAPRASLDAVDPGNHCCGSASGAFAALLHTPGTYVLRLLYTTPEGQKQTFYMVVERAFGDLLAFVQDLWAARAATEGATLEAVGYLRDQHPGESDDWETVELWVNEASGAEHAAALRSQLLTATNDDLEYESVCTPEWAVGL